ncbi:MAG: hypothetical protein MHM6MM_001359 [Cercozoa sp. M6MM]
MVFLMSVGAASLLSRKALPRSAFYLLWASDLRRVLPGLRSHVEQFGGESGVQLPNHDRVLNHDSFYNDRDQIHGVLRQQLLRLAQHEIEEVRGQIFEEASDKNGDVVATDSPLEMSEYMVKMPVPKLRVAPSTLWPGLQGVYADCEIPAGSVVCLTPGTVYTSDRLRLLFQDNAFDEHGLRRVRALTSWCKVDPALPPMTWRSSPSESNIFMSSVPSVPPVLSPDAPWYSPSRLSNRFTYFAADVAADPTSLFAHGDKIVSPKNEEDEPNTVALSYNFGAEDFPFARFRWWLPAQYRSQAQMLNRSSLTSTEVFVATRDIKKDEELTTDWKLDDQCELRGGKDEIGSEDNLSEEERTRLLDALRVNNACTGDNETIKHITAEKRRLLLQVPRLLSKRIEFGDISENELRRGEEFDEKRLRSSVMEIARRFVWKE